MDRNRIFIYEGGIFVELWINGIYTALLLLTIWLIVSKKEYDRRQKITFITWNMVPYLVATVHPGLSWHAAMEMFTGNVTVKPAFRLTYVACFIINNNLAEAVFIWRCWVVRGRKWKAVVLPIALTLAGTGLALFLVIQTGPGSIIGGYQLTLYSIFPTTSVLLTTLLTTLRIVQVQRSTAQFGLTLKRRFNPVIEIIVESAALFTISLIGYTIFNVLDTLSGGSGVSLCVQNIHVQISGLVPLLINLRVQAGFARPADEWSAASLAPSNPLRFASRRRTDKEVVQGVSDSSDGQRHSVV